MKYRPILITLKLEYNKKNSGDFKTVVVLKFSRVEITTTFGDGLFMCEVSKRSYNRCPRYRADKFREKKNKNNYYNK